MRETRPGSPPVQGRRHRQAHLSTWSSRHRSSCSRKARIVGTIQGGTPDARIPLAPVLPRRCTRARGHRRIDYLSIDSDLLDVMITWDQTGNYEVGELRAGSGATDDDWMTHAAADRAFHRIPPANLQAIFMRMQRMTYSAGDVVIKQGDEGDLLLRHRRGPLPRHARDAAQPRRHQARRARHGRNLRRGSADLRRQAQRHGHHADRRRR